MVLKKTPVYLITGFLGSGKTTFLKQVIDNYADRKKIAVIQNEFAPANFDGKELKRTTNKNFDLLEVNNGSVFCVCLLSGFINSLSAFVQQHNPDIILLEASGLSDPVSLGEMFNSPVLQKDVFLAGTICIVDAQNFLKTNKLVQRVQHQLKIAHHVIINKTDLNKSYDRIIEKVNEINPLATKHITQFCNVPFDSIMQPVSENFDKIAFEAVNSSTNMNRPDIYSAVFRSTRPLKHNCLYEFIEILASKSCRVKGYIHLDNDKNIAIQLVYRDIDTQEVSSPIRQTELIAMGYEIDARGLKQLYQRFI